MSKLADLVGLYKENPIEAMNGVVNEADGFQENFIRATLLETARVNPEKFAEILFQFAQQAQNGQDLPFFKLLISVVLKRLNKSDRLIVADSSVKPTIQD